MMKLQQLAMLVMAVVCISQSVAAQSASFSGKVMVDPTEKPLANVEILFINLKRSVRSDSAGNFFFSGLPAGKHSVSVRLVGYESSNAEITFGSTQKMETDFLLKPTTTKLANVEVTATSSHYAMRLVDFEERRKFGTGKFLTADYFEKNEGRPLSSLFVDKIAGIRFVQSGGRHWLASTRGGFGGVTSATMEKRPPACYAQIIVNGIVRYNGNGQPMFDLDELQTTDIIGFEYYTTANTPAQFNMTRGTAACGTAVIWTK